MKAGTVKKLHSALENGIDPGSENHSGLTCCLLLFSVAAHPVSHTILLAPLLLFLSTLLLASENWHLLKERKEYN